MTEPGPLARTSDQWLRVWASRWEFVPVSMMVPLNVSRSTIAPHLEQEFGAASIKFHVAKLVDQEQVDAPVPGDGAGQLFLASSYIGHRIEFSAGRPHGLQDQVGGEPFLISDSSRREMVALVTTPHHPAALRSRCAGLSGERVDLRLGCGAYPIDDHRAAASRDGGQRLRSVTLEY